MEGRTESRPIVRERQPQAEQKPAPTPAVRTDAKTKQPRRVWQIAPRETPKEAQPGEKPQREQKEQRPQREREGK
ncbi:hypothetical protein OR1_00782 [Geobacter sp. OR-1]|nr:hypothetical protein OR1_00782 [Geobacter sp. OR-1]